MPPPNPASTPDGGVTSDMYGVSAGLDLVSGVFGYLTSLNSASMARSRADLIEAEANANAQRYEEEAQHREAQTAMMYVASGVRLSGSPIDALATEARIASENVASIEMQGKIQALDQSVTGTEAELKGRDMLVGGLVGAGKSLYQGFGNAPSGAQEGTLAPSIASGPGTGNWSIMGGMVGP